MWKSIILAGVIRMMNKLYLKIIENMKKCEEKNWKIRKGDEIN